MGSLLPKLRHGLDIMPSPVAERPGLLIRDPFRYTEEILIIPPLLARGLALFDGEQTERDLQVHLSRLSGQIVPREITSSLIEGLKNHGFLETEEFEMRRAQRHSEFAASPFRAPAHAGSGYPEQPTDLRKELDAFRADPLAVLSNDNSPVTGKLLGIAAPHVSPQGGAACYGAAYNQLSAGLSPVQEPRTIVILGTSHYGEPERFGLTRKQFSTPFGCLEVDQTLVDWLQTRAPDAVVMEDYCHAIEHSIEFQCVFLQHALGDGFKILPILCGPFAEATISGTPPERDDQVRRFLAALSEMSDCFGEHLCWVLGVDMAHVGRRYGDRMIARSNQGEMIEVEEKDRARLNRVCAGDADGFLNLVVEERDPLKWCGFSPIYTFLKSVEGARGQVVRYDQWNIDEQSVVSFAAMSFTRGSAPV
ncbi:MAG: AmmeMemoRadiSam system protein B [Acidobacteriota bacterium]